MKKDICFIKLLRLINPSFVTISVDNSEQCSMFHAGDDV